MVKVKKNFAKKPALEVQQAEPEQEAYDSMIENGTSEESSDNESINEEMKASSEDSDDGFSEQEESAAVAPKNKVTPATTTTKRKSQADNISVVAPNTSKKSKIVEKVKPPTLEEINELKETRNLFHSNLFRLQVKEMLSEVKIKEKYKNYINSWLEQFKRFVSKLETATEKEDVHKMKWLLKSPLEVPLALEKLHIEKQKTFQFQFIKPTSEPYLIGAAATETLLGSPQYVADVCLTMPAESFQKDNYLNIVYEQKRAFYLTYIANKMLGSKEFGEALTVEQLKFNYYANDPLKPVLEITPAHTAGSLANKLCIRIFVAAEERSFKLNRFVPWNSNIRATLFGNDEDDDVGSADEESSVVLATPHYNAGVLFDLTMQRNQQLLKETFGSNKNFQEGLVLLKVWLQQRQLNVGFSGFRTHIMAMFMVHLFKQRKLHTNMSSYQVARNVWNHLAHSAWDEHNKGITLHSSATAASNAAANQPTLEQFHVYYDVVFVDVSGFYNICSQLCLEMYRRVRTEAKLAVDLLNDMKLNSFQLIFMTKCPIYTQFDHILKINRQDVIEQILDMHVLPAEKYDYVGYGYPQLLKAVTSLLRKGLGERIHTLLPIELPSEAWSAKEQANGCVEYLHLGLILNPEHAYEVLDKGPEAIAEGAEEFRKFWGKKAQLRRFQDGSITESVVWAAATDTLMKKRLIVRSIVLHLLLQHFQVEPSQLEYIAGEFEVVYKLTSAFKIDHIRERYPIESDTDAEALSLQVIRAFDDLARKLHGLTDLPLEIVSIAGISPVFRYCEPRPVLPQARLLNDEIHAMSVQRGVIQLGLSGKWPSELTALRALKTAFYIQIAQLLREKHRLRIKVTHDGLLIMKQGFCFAIEMAHPKEIALLKRATTERGITQYVDCDASIALQKRHYILPKVTGALHALYQLHPSFGATVMIAKRWLYSQLIDDGLWPEECTELLIASQFLKRSAQQMICSPQTGFLRFLHLLAHTDWKTELFLINFNNGMDENENIELEQRFNTARDTFPPLCIVTAYDQKHYGQLWTSSLRPNVHVLARVTLLARQALAIIEPALLTPDEKFIKPSKIFTASNQGYDLVIQIKPELVANTLAFDFGSAFVAFAKPNWRMPLANTNYLSDAVAKLREAYSDYAAFFYNPCGGKEIAVVWKPASVFAAKEFKVTEVNCCSLSDSSSNAARVQCKKETLIEDFKFILKDFYLRIDTVESVLQASRESTIIANKNRYFDQTAANAMPEFSEQKPPQSAATKQSNGKVIKSINQKKSKQQKSLELKYKVKPAKKTQEFKKQIANNKKAKNKTKNKTKN